MLERLADLIRAQDTKKGFKANSEMLSITGLSFIQLKDILENLGYKSENIPLPEIKTLGIDKEKNLKNIINNNDKDKNLGLPEEKLDFDEINQNQIIFKFDYKKIKISKTFNKSTKNKIDHTKAIEIKNKNNFKIKKNKDRKRLDPNNPFAALASLIKDNKDKFN